MPLNATLVDWFPNYLQIVKESMSHLFKQKHVLPFLGIVLVLFFQTPANGQERDTIYYDMDSIVDSKDSAYSVRYIHFDTTSCRFIYDEFYVNIFIGCNSFKEKGELLSITPEVKDGEFEWEDDLGNRVVALYRENKFVDILEYKDQNNQSIEPIYSMGMVDQGLNYKGEELKGFYQKINQFIVDYKAFTSLDTSSKFYINMIIQKDGSLTDINLLRIFGIDSEVEPQLKEYIKTLKLPPVKHRGKYVKTSFTIPVNLCLK